MLILQVYTLLSILGDVGGIQEILIFIGALCAGGIADKLMFAELFKQIYHYEKDDSEDAKKRKRKKSQRYPKIYDDFDREPDAVR